MFPYSKRDIYKLDYHFITRINKGVVSLILVFPACQPPVYGFVTERVTYVLR